MKTVTLDAIKLPVVILNSIGKKIKKIIRYVPDDEVPDTHIAMYDSASEQWEAADGKFYVKFE